VNPPTRIKDLPAGERPRERLVARGAETLTATDLVAILLRTGSQGRSALQLAAELVARYGRLDQLARASLEEIQEVKGIGPDKAVTLKAAFALALQMSREAHEDAPLCDTPERVAGLLREENRLYTVECFQAVLVNTRRRLVRTVKLSQGTLDTLLVHPREVFRPAILAEAAAIVLVHNHPSGDPTPSEQDIKVTRDLIRAGQLLRIDVLDHLILGRKTAERTCDFVSLRELGYFAV
jgi:DNA repair protein RadC